MKSILIIGISGGLAQITKDLFLKKYPDAHITGVDSRAVANLGIHERVTNKTIKYTRSHFEKIFRDVHYDLVIQLGRLSHTPAYTSDALSHRLDVNLTGTRCILDLSLKFGVKKVILLSSYHVYGALSDNPVFLDEDQPLRGSIKHRELRDVIEMDQMSSNWMWKNQKKIQTLILRPCTVIGPKINNLMMKYLLTSYAPICSDFNPMLQFLHEFDLANIIVRSSKELDTGIYNVAPEECISLRRAKNLLKVPTLPVPSFFLSAAAKMTDTLWIFPQYLLDFIKYSCVIDSALLKKSLLDKSSDELFKYSTKNALLLSKLD
jgi:UDP-glucose 4-epimerase